MSPPLILDRQVFLKQYWQREPLLMARALPDFRPPINADELAGLALEPGVESRIIELRGDSWLLHHGPFASGDFHRDTLWTLLVQSVDHYCPQVAALRRLIDFLPQWRVDDIMVSYAVDGGSVGPHYDNYDVFLLQGEGERLWKLGQACDETTGLLAHDELRLLSDFDQVEEHLLRCGDILYVPAGVAHWGIAQGECTTFSIGFRAPRVYDMVSRWVDHLLESTSTESYYTDSIEAGSGRPGELSRTDLDRAQEVLKEALENVIDQRWFGELVTEPRQDLELEPQLLCFEEAILQTGMQAVALSPAARLAWQEEGAGVVVFANGESEVFSPRVLNWLVGLCEHWRVEGSTLTAAMADPEGLRLLAYLYERGCFDEQ